MSKDTVNPMPASTATPASHQVGGAEDADGLASDEADDDAEGDRIGEGGGEPGQPADGDAGGETREDRDGESGRQWGRMLIAVGAELTAHGHAVEDDRPPRGGLIELRLNIRRGLPGQRL